MFKIDVFQGKGRSLAIRAFGIAALSLTALSAQAQTEWLVAVTGNNQIARIEFDPFGTTLGTATYVNITGLDAGDQFIGIDRRRVGQYLIYGLTRSNKLYTINPMTGSAAFLGALSSPIVDSNQTYGLDFNPADEGWRRPSLHVIGSGGAHYAVDVATDIGHVTNLAPVTSGLSGLAFNLQGTSTWFVDAANDTLRSASDFTGTANTLQTFSLGPLGLDVLSVGGLERPDFGSVAYGAFAIAGGDPLTTGIYRINLSTSSSITSRLTLLGTINGTVTGLTSGLPVPEPGTFALFGAGLIGLALVRRRKD